MDNGGLAAGCELGKIGFCARIAVSRSHNNHFVCRIDCARANTGNAALQVLLSMLGRNDEGNQRRCGRQCVANRVAGIIDADTRVDLATVQALIDCSCRGDSASGFSVVLSAVLPGSTRE